MEFQRSRINEIITEIKNDEQRNIVIIMLLSSWVVIIIVSLILWLIMTINQPIQQIAIFVEKISCGDLPEPLDELWEGELDGIRKNINVMREAIQALYTIDKYIGKTIFPSDEK